MSRGTALVAMLALLFAAAALALWRRGAQKHERMLAARFVERQVMASHATPRPRTARQPEQSRASANTHSGVSVEIARDIVRARAAYGHLMRRAGIERPRAFFFVTLVAAALAAFWMTARTNALLGLAAAALVLAVTAAALFWRAQKRRQRIVRQLPSFMDGIVRLIVIGHSVPAAFQTALASTEPPLADCLDRVLPMLRTGMEIDHALGAVARMYRVRELELVGAVLRVSVKYGGRSDVMLDRMSALMRDLEQADRELVALSTETRLSSWVLGLLPVLLGAAVIVTNPQYFDAMWTDPLGQRLVYAALGLQMLGVWLLFRMARLRT
ncbi:type II secretion system F family protein [Caballeronia sp. HLA56]